MNVQEIISSGILELYSMGQTSAKETAEVEQWIKQYPEVAAEYDAIQKGLETYAIARGVEPLGAVKEKLFSKINQTTSTPVVNLEPQVAVTPVYKMSPVWKFAAAASVILLIGSLIINYNYYNKYQATATELAASQSELQQQRSMVDAMQRDMGVMSDKNAMPVSLAGLPDVADAAARIYWVRNTGEVYIDPSNLPAAPKGKQYQFWAIVDGKPVSGGMINTVDGNKKVTIQKMKSFGNAQAFAVSLEDAGPEAPAPTKVMVMGTI